MQLILSSINVIRESTSVEIYFQVQVRLFPLVQVHHNLFDGDNESWGPVLVRVIMNPVIKRLRCIIIFLRLYHTI